MSKVLNDYWEKAIRHEWISSPTLMEPVCVKCGLVADVWSEGWFELFCGEDGRSVEDTDNV